MLKFYLISTVLCWSVAFISSKAMDAKLKREGKKRIKVNYSVFEKTQTLLPLLIPIANIFLALIFIFMFDEICKRAETELITES